MKMSFSKYENYHKEEVVLLMKEGNFYSCHLKDTYVMNYLFSFQLIYPNHLVKVSFSKKILEKVKNTLSTRNCSYAIFSFKCFMIFYTPNNCYLEYLNQENYLKDQLLSELLSYFAHSKNGKKDSLSIKTESFFIFLLLCAFSLCKSLLSFSKVQRLIFN